MVSFEYPKHNIYAINEKKILGGEGGGGGGGGKILLSYFKTAL